MKIVLFLLLSTTTLFAQDGFRITTSKSETHVYHQAYLNCSAMEMTRIVNDLSSSNPSKSVSSFINEYPILNSLKEFKKRRKYSLIDSRLLAIEPTLTDDNKLLFTLKNGKKYKIDIFKRVSSIY